MLAPIFLFIRPGTLDYGMVPPTSWGWSPPQLNLSGSGFTDAQEAFPDDFKSNQINGEG